MRFKISLVLSVFIFSSLIYQNDLYATKSNKSSKKSGCFSCFSCFRHSPGADSSDDDAAHNNKDQKEKIDVTDIISVSPLSDLDSSNSDVKGNNIIDDDVPVKFENKIFQVKACAPECNQKVFVLSLDGGGMRGVILARILMHLEEITKTPLHHLFNLVSGTSTGGLITLALTMPDPINPEKSLYTSAQILEHYLEKRDDIFVKRNFLELPGILKSKYDPQGLEDFCREMFQKTRLSQLLAPAFVTAFNDTDNKLVTFGSHSAFLGRTKNMQIWKAGRITAAAPYYFTSVVDDEGDILRDGGLAANNPSAVALSEIRLLFPHKKLEDIIVVSIGTGENKGEELKTDLSALHINKIVKQFEQGQLAAVDQSMVACLGENYIRIQTTLPDALKTDNISDEYIAMMIQSAEQAIDQNAGQFERLKNLWNTQFDTTGSFKHFSSYDVWHQMQSDVMNGEQMKIADLNQIQEIYQMKQ